MRWNLWSVCSVSCMLGGACLVVPEIAFAGGPRVFDLEDSSQWKQWMDALAHQGKKSISIEDLDGLPDFGYSPFDGPLGKEGSDLIPTGFFQWATIDSNLHPHGGDGLAGRGAGGLGLLALGPSAGWGNTSNAVLSNFAEDSLDIYRRHRWTRRTALELTLLSIGGSGTLDLTVWSDEGERFMFEGLDVAPVGHRYGLIWETDFGWGRGIERVNLYDPGGGYEGFSYLREYTTPPAPAGFAVLIGAMVIGRRRRQ